MRLILNILLFLFFVLIIPATNFASTYTFNDDFNNGIGGWNGIIGTWGNPGGTLQSSGSDYSTILKNGSDQGGLYQSITVDAYFGLTDNNDSIAQLRLRNGTVWDSGYMANFQTDGIYLYNWSNHSQLGYNPNGPFFSTPGWYILKFDVAGRGDKTNLKVWVEDTLVLDVKYNDTTGGNDNGHIGLGRLIKYDNAGGYSSDTPIPEPGTILLLGSGILGLAGVYRRKK